MSKKKKKIKKTIKKKTIKKKHKKNNLSFKKTLSNKTLPKTSKPLTKRNKKKHIGSDCIYCSLEEGVMCMMYFCKLNTKKDKFREICYDGFTGNCPNYKKAKV